MNAGHDLDLHNLVLFRDLPHLDEVSIGHAIMSRALFVGLNTVVAIPRVLWASSPAGFGRSAFPRCASACLLAFLPLCLPLAQRLRLPA